MSGIGINYAGRLVSNPMSKKQRNEYIREHFDIPGLREIGFLRGERSFDDIERRIITFFGLSDIREFSQRDEAVASVGVHLSFDRSAP